MVSGIVGAGGNLGAMLMGFVLKMEGVTYQQGLMYIGMAVSAISLSAFFIVPRLAPSDSLDSALQPEMIPVPVEKGIHNH